MPACPTGKEGGREEGAGRQIAQAAQVMITEMASPLVLLVWCLCRRRRWAKGGGGRAGTRDRQAGSQAGRPWHCWETQACWSPRPHAPPEAGPKAHHHTCWQAGMRGLPTHTGLAAAHHVAELHDQGAAGDALVGHRLRGAAPGEAPAAGPRAAGPAQGRRRRQLQELHARGARLGGPLPDQHRARVDRVRLGAGGRREAGEAGYERTCICTPGPP